MNIEEMKKEENFEHEVLDRLKCLDPMDFDYNAVDGSYVEAVLKARDIILTAYEKEKEKNKKIEIIVNKLMPLAECSYWNYENHTCTHTCRDCVDLNDDNKRTASGIIIDKDRYCRLYEDGYAEEDTKFVNVEDLINRHLEEE